MIFFFQGWNNNPAFCTAAFIAYITKYALIWFSKFKKFFSNNDRSLTLHSARRGKKKERKEPVIFWLLSSCWIWHLGYKLNQPSKDNQEKSLTVSEPRRVVIDICERDRYRGGAGEATHLANHVFGLDDENILIPRLPVHVWQSCSDDTWWKNQRGRFQVCIYNTLSHFHQNCLSSLSKKNPKPQLSLSWRVSNISNIVLIVRIVIVIVVYTL